MILPDGNVLVGAFRADAPRHGALRRWLASAVADVEDLGLTDAALAQVAALSAADGVIRVTPGPRHWEIGERLCRAADARGNLVADAAHAAVAIEHGALWVTLDRDVARFPGLRWGTPLEASG